MVLTEKVLYKAHDLVIRASQRLNKDKVEFNTQLLKATTQFDHILTAMGNVNYYLCSLKPQVIYGSHYNRKTCRIALCFKIRSRSLHCLMLSYTRP